MRIGIDYRFLMSGISVNRGMGRYTQQQLREVLKVDRNNDYVLFCPAGADLSLIWPEIRTAPNVSLAANPLVVDSINLVKTEKILAYAEAFQDWIYQERVDLFHATTPLLLSHGEANLANFNVCPLVVTFYDLIPLLFADQYLVSAQPTRDLYLRQLLFTLKANRFIAISNAARRDAVNYLGYPQEKIDVAYPMADPWFCVLSRSEIEQRLASLRAKSRLPSEFVMTVSHLHYSKNLETLFKGYGQLPATFRRRFPLVATFLVTEPEKQLLRQWADKYGIVDDLVLTDFVSESELVALYNAATLVVHPSRYEGFGLPVLEAMSSGAPVLTTTASSLPEVAGSAGVLVDPDDPQAFAEAIADLCQNPARRQAMRELGLEQVKRFDGAQLACATINSYGKTASSKSAAALPAKRHVALWSPVPPVPSGVADYTVELLPYLAQDYELEVFVDDGYLPPLDLLSRYTIQHYSAFERRQAARPFDVVLYQMGASTFHSYMYAALQKWPGIVVLHDLVWGRVIYFESVRANRADDFTRAVLDLEGPEALREFEAIRVLPAADRAAAIETFLDTHYLLKEIVAKSLGLVVPMEVAKQELEAKYQTTKVHVVPMGVKDPYLGLSTHAMDVTRAELGLNPKAFVVGIFGILDPVKRLEACLQAFRKLQQAYPAARLIFVGEAFDLAYKRRLLDLAGKLGISQFVHFTGHIAVSDPDTHGLYDRILIACDVVVNLRYPSRKQMSGALMRAVAAGKPVIITNLPEWGHFPDSFCWRVTPDAQEVETLTDYLFRLAGDRSLCLARAASARAYFEQAATVATMAHSYREVIRQVTGWAADEDQAIADPQPPLRTFGHNRLCEAEDFDDSELAQIVGAVFGHEIGQTTKALPPRARLARYWQSAMCVRALRHFNVLHPDAIVLGVGVGYGALAFYLTRYVRQVFATDLYLDLSRWEGLEPLWWLAAPDKFAPYPFERNGLVVQHMDGCALAYPDNQFDAVFALDVVGRLESLEAVSRAVREMGRVLKPGGVLVLTVRFQLAAPTSERYNKGCFSREALQEYIVGASRLALVDGLQLVPSEKTQTSPRDLASAADPAILPEVSDLVTVRHGLAFGVVHLTFQKSAALLAAESPRPAPLENGRDHFQPDFSRIYAALSSAFSSQPAKPATASPARVVSFQAWIARWVRRIEPPLYGTYVRVLNRLPRSVAHRVEAGVPTLKVLLRRVAQLLRIER